VGWISDLWADIASGDYLFVAALALLLGFVLWRLYWAIFRSGEFRPAKRLSGLTFQIGLTLIMERLYEFARAHVAVDQLTALAYSNGSKIADFEITHGFFFEQGLERLFLPDTLLMHAIYGFYAFAHLFVTLGFLVWLYLRRNEYFSFVRNLFYATTGVALIVYMVFPTAPPRSFTNFGFVDPAVLLGISPPGGLPASQQMYNPYAAMPSLHMVYALIVGATLVAIGRHWWLRLAGAVYPVVMLAVVLISANHWILDACGSVVVVAGCTLILAALRFMVRQLPQFAPLLVAPVRRLSSSA